MSKIRDEIKYDVALSFAEEDREIAKKLANALREKEIDVFYDKFYKSELWGIKLADYFQESYGRRVRFVIPLVSKYYPIKAGANFEFSVAVDEAKRRKNEFILPVRLDDTKISGLPYNIGYLDFNKEKIDGIVKCIVEKLKKDDARSDEKGEDMAHSRRKDVELPSEAIKVELKKTFSEKDAAKLALSFKTVQ